MIHIPVLIREVLEYLDPKPNENFIDGTVGEGSHAIEILERNKPEGKVLGIDWDAKQVENSKFYTSRFKERIIVVNGSYANMKDIAERMHFTPVHGISLDLGYSSWQIEQSGKGFSFNKDEALDMRFNAHNPVTAEKIINEYSELAIEKIIREYGEEKFSKQIAREIVRQRKIKKIQSTFELNNVIERAMPLKSRHGRIHYATRTFQALRIAVNGELDNLQKGLLEAISILSPGGRLVVISFHSLEDRIVKQFIRNNNLKQLNKKVIMSKDRLEFESSAKLRIIEV